MACSCVPSVIMNFSRVFLRAVVLAVSVGCGLSAIAQSPLNSITGSPFSTFVGAGANSSVVLMPPNGNFMFVTNRDSDQITVLDVAPNGSLSFNSSWSSPSRPVGMATDPSGAFLYVTHVSSASLDVYSISPSGALSLIQTIGTGVTGSRCLNGITYVRRLLGDFVYVNNNLAVSGTNRVSRFSVAPLLGTLAPPTVMSTAGAGPGATIPPQFLAARRIAATSSGFLYVLNQSPTTPFTSSISTFSIDVSGNLLLVGAPVSLGAPGSGAMAVDPTGTFLCVATGVPGSGTGGNIIRYNISGGAPASPASFPSGIALPVSDIAFDPSGFRLFVCIPDSNAICVLDAATGAPLTGSPVTGDSLPANPGDGPSSLAFDLAGSHLFVGNANGNPSLLGTTIVSVYEIGYRPTITNPATVDGDCGTAGIGLATVNIPITVQDLDGDAITVTWKVDGVPVQTDNVGAGVPLPTNGLLSLTYTYSAGVHTVEIIASDGKLQPTTALTTVRVLVDVDGFTSPMSSLVPSGNIPPMPGKAFKMGRTIPLKLKLLCHTTELTDTQVGPPKITAIVRDGNALDLDTIDLDAGASNDNGVYFRYAGGTWIYNLMTTGLGTGTFKITIEAPDGRQWDAAFVLR